MSEKRILHAIFAGDVHLSDRIPERELAFNRFLDSVCDIKPDHVFLMGDIFEFWFGYQNVMFSKYIRSVGKIARFAEMGIPVSYLVGNHDFKPGPVFSELLGVTIHLEPIRIRLGENLVYLSHGDEINDRDRKYLFLRSVFRHPASQFLFQHLVPPSLAWYIGRGVSNKSRQYNSKRERPIPDDVFESFCRREAARGVNYVLHGHNHDPGTRIWHTSERALTIIDTGDWLGNSGHYVEFRDNRFECKTWPF